MIISVAPEDFVRLGIAEVELERLCERLDGRADLLLRELAVAEGVPAPRRARLLRHVLGQQRFDLGELALADQPFELRDSSVRPAASAAFVSRSRLRLASASAAFSSTACRYAAIARLRVALLLERRSEVALSVGGLGLQLARMPEFRHCCRRGRLARVPRGLPPCRGSRSGPDRPRRPARGPS